MARYILDEDGVDHFLLEDGSGLILNEREPAASGTAIMPATSTTFVSGPGGNAWVTPGNAVGDTTGDGLVASFDNGINGGPLVQDYGFDPVTDDFVPAGSVISSVSIGGLGVGATQDGYGVSPMKNGSFDTPATISTIGPWTVPYTTLTPTLAELRSAVLGAELGTGASQGDVGDTDYIRLEVVYTAPGGATAMLDPMGASGFFGA